MQFHAPIKTLPAFQVGDDVAFEDTGIIRLQAVEDLAADGRCVEETGQYAFREISGEFSRRGGGCQIPANTVGKLGVYKWEKLWYTL